MSLIVDNVVKTYENGLIPALTGVSFHVEPAEVVAVMGPSGSGKSTLLNLMGTLDRPSSGKIFFNGKDVFSYRPLHRFRSRSIGFVFQFHHLIPSLTLSENVEMVLIPARVRASERRTRALALLQHMGLASRSSFLPARTSGGERQRAAIARALIHNPEIVLADEPTGNLDTETGAIVMNLLIENCRKRNTSVVIATHNPEVSLMADRRILLRNGRLA